MRETTERPEGIEVGNAILVGSDRERIKQELSKLIEHPEIREQMGSINNPYGDGKAAERIVAILREEFYTAN